GGWFSQEVLGNQGHFREDRRQVLDGLGAFVDGQQRRNQTEEIFSISERVVQHKVLLKGSVRRRRLRHHGLQAGMLENGQLGGPIGAEALAVDAHSVLVY